MKIDIARLAALAEILEGSSPDQTYQPQTVVANPPTSPLIGTCVIVRSRDSGVHFGRLEALNGRQATLRDARRLWYWVAAKEHTLSAVAVHGIKAKSKIATSVSLIEVLDACEIIATTEVAQSSIYDAPAHDPS